MALKNGIKAVTTHAVPVCLVSTSTPCQSVAIQAKSGNAGAIVVGGVGIVGAVGATRNGIALAANQTITLDYIADLNEVYLDCVTDGDAVSYVYQQ